jgi:hypothetical protein
VYLNGALAGTDTYTPDPPEATASSLFISGNANDMQYWKGYIDEVSIWNVARSQSDIQNTMFGPLAGSENGLVGYWNLEQGYGGPTVYDVTSGGDNGTIYGATWSPNNAPNAPPVPEPASLCLLGLACGGIGAMVKRRKKA